mgnify:CR=1 FL=1|jgi:hypothetical protein
MEPVGSKALTDVLLFVDCIQRRSCESAEKCEINFDTIPPYLN